MKKRTFYQLAVNENDRTADINIYGEITSHAELYEAFGLSEGEVSGRGFKAAIDGLDVDVINVYINSYGGEVAEALAIHSVLKRHSAKVHTFVDGFACSAATIIFCAGDTRTMGSLALLMIHDCTSRVPGYANSRELRKAADDNDVINSRSIKVYGEVSALPEEKIIEMMAEETWLTAEKCLEYGFATDVEEDDDEDELPEQTAFGLIREAVLRNASAAELQESALAEEVASAVVSALQEIGVVTKEKQKEPDPHEAPAGQNTVKRFFNLLAL